MEKLKLAYTIIALIVSLAAAAFLRKRRRLQRRLCCYLLSNESKPQSSFKHVLVDNSYSSFKHLNRTEDSNSHPYEKEISSLMENSQIEDLRFVNGEVNLELKGNHVWIAKEEQLKHLLEVLSKETVFAVDTEQHSLRSFLGFTALMQISTHTEDYLVDTIALHDVVHILRPVFADPKICKVFHGADSDVIWLQRDFHIYVVNLFDTAKACEVLSKPQRSLAYLLETYCGVATNKVLQREDWRLRPLSEEMVQYARTDAHYLLYIADRMANELKAHDTEKPEFLHTKFHFLLEASRLSNRICLQRYTKEAEVFPGNSAASSISSRYLNGHGVPLKSETMKLVEWWCMWRDIMARVHDESLRYVLSDQAILELASKASKTGAEIYGTISEAGLSLDSVKVDSVIPSPSPVIFSHLEDICYLLAEKVNNLDDVFGRIIQKHLGPGGSCSLSIYNYALLKESNLMVTNAKQNGGKISKRFGRKAPRQLSEDNHSCKSPVYDNCRIYASDGRLLCYSYRRKLEWYLSRDLAKLVDNDPPSIMLFNEPRGRPENDYVQSKENMCVGCGERNHYRRYRIIPSCYKMHFPEHLKSHSTHDIVLVCVDCQKVAHSAAEKHKRRIAVEVGIPLFGSEKARMLLRSAARALVRHGSDMPSERREELTQTLAKFLGGTIISEEDLKGALLVGTHKRRRRSRRKWNSTVDDFPNGINCDRTSVREANHNKEYEDGLEMNTSVGDVHEHSDLTSSNDVTEEGHRQLSEDTSSKGDEDGMEMNTTVGDVHEHCDLTSATDVTEEANGIASSTYNKRLSLLGYKAHGKQVVDHLLKEYGEDGIRDFCQSWRQVFVEAIQPRFLPSGWDVNVMRTGGRVFNCDGFSHSKLECPKLQGQGGKENGYSNDDGNGDQDQQQQQQNTERPCDAAESEGVETLEIKGNCYNCGQQGHKMVNCPQPLNF